MRDIRSKNRVITYAASFLLVAGFACLVFLGVTPVLSVLADRKTIPPHSFLSHALSYGFRPIGFVLESEPMPKVVSRDVRHYVQSIIYRPEE